MSKSVIDRQGYLDEEGGLSPEPLMRCGSFEAMRQSSGIGFLPRGNRRTRRGGNGEQSQGPHGLRDRKTQGLVRPPHVPKPEHQLDPACRSLGKMSGSAAP